MFKKNWFNIYQPFTYNWRKLNIKNKFTKSLFGFFNLNFLLKKTIEKKRKFRLVKPNNMKQKFENKKNDYKSFKNADKFCN